MTLDFTTVESPIGPITLVAHGDALVGLEFEGEKGRLKWLRDRLANYLGAVELREAADPGGAATRLAAYFAGDLSALSTQPVELLGTPFQRTVWNALLEIPVGRTESYSGLAARIGSPSAMRAVGAANGSNPIGIFVPCHRVLAADLTLHGYGGGLDRKAWLLDHEGATWRATRRGPSAGQADLFSPRGARASATAAATR
jgi:methylated-DNA-[protein]-cysteine S-methyltransferase